MTTTTVARSEVRLREQELEEARQRLESIETRLRAGDATVTSADLARAKADVEHASLALEGALNQARNSAFLERERAGNELYQEWLTAAPAAAAAIIEQARDAVASLGRLLDLVAEYEQLRHGFKLRFDSIFTEAQRQEAAARQFYWGDSWGKLAEGVRAVSIPNPGLLAVSLIGEALKESRKGMSPGDRHWLNHVIPQNAAHEMKTIQQIARLHDTEETT